jgi:hypothetical protein
MDEHPHSQKTSYFSVLLTAFESPCIIKTVTDPEMAVEVE